MHNIKSLVLFLLAIYGNFFIAFAGIKTTFTYGNNKAYNEQNINLQADIYKPNLFATKLPVVIIYHGGGYASGDKNMAQLKVFSDKFNAKNISTILPDFRQGWYESETKGLCESATPTKFKDAAHRAFQDCRALIRYCKANANTLGIDSNKIFLFGISSGGFLAMHSLYINDSTVEPERLARLGSLDFQSNTLKNTTDVAGIISVVGGFYEAQPKIIRSYPLLLFNNTCDGAVDFFNGWLGNCSHTARSFGPGIFTKTLEQYAVPYDLHVFCGFNHGFNSVLAPQGGDASAIDYILQKSVAFIQEINNGSFHFATHIASDSITSEALYNCRNFETFYWCKEDSAEIGNDYFSLTPNPITCALQPKLNCKQTIYERLQLEVVNELGQTISQKKINEATIQNIIYLNQADFSTGINILLIRNENGKIIFRTKVMKYCQY